MGLETYCEVCGSKYKEVEIRYIDDRRFCAVCWERALEKACRNSPNMVGEMYAPFMAEKAVEFYDEAVEAWKAQIIK
jgi:hypothetical protein